MPLSGRQRQGKFRFRSTPCALPRVPACTPSGLRSGTSQRSTPGGARSRLSSSTIPIPAGSFPWMQPTTSTFGPSGSPSSIAVIARLLTEFPSFRIRCGRGPAEAVTAATPASPTAAETRIARSPQAGTARWSPARTDYRLNGRSGSRSEQVGEVDEAVAARLDVVDDRPERVGVERRAVGRVGPDVEEDDLAGLELRQDVGDNAPPGLSSRRPL